MTLERHARRRALEQSQNALEQRYNHTLKQRMLPPVRWNSHDAGTGTNDAGTTTNVLQCAGTATNSTLEPPRRWNNQEMRWISQTLEQSRNALDQSS